MPQLLVLELFSCHDPPSWANLLIFSSTLLLPYPTLNLFNLAAYIRGLQSILITRNQDPNPTSPG